MPSTHKPLKKQDLHALRSEIRLSETLVEKELMPRIKESIERYTGKYLPDIASDWSILLNELYPVVQYELPTIFFRNPKVFLKPRNKFYIAKRRNALTGEMEEVQVESEKSAKTQEAILNYEMDQMRYKQEVRKTLLDALLAPYGVLWHGYKGDFGMTQERSYYIRKEDVFVSQIPPNKFLFDPTVSINNIDQARWVGRSLWMKLTDVMEDDDLDVDKSALKGVMGYGEKIGKGDEPNAHRGGEDTIHLGSTSKRLIEHSDKEFQQLPHSRFVEIYEIFLRPTPKEEREGQQGRILLLTFEQQRPLRDNSWKYKAQGFPCKILQFNPVPGNRFGLSDFEIFGSIADHKNLVVNQQIRNAEQLNRVIVGLVKEGADEESIAKVQNGESDVVLFDGDVDIRAKMAVINMGGGASNELYILDQRIDKNLQDKSGVSDLKKGFLQSGEESATSVKLRAAGSSARPAYRQDLMADFLKESVTYINELLKQFMPVKKAVRILGTLDVEWSENPSKEEIQADTDAEIDVQSMLPESPEREIQELTTILNLMVQALTTPEILSKLGQEGKTFNLGPILEQLLYRLKIRNPEAFRNIRAEESEGYVEVAELRAAQANVQAALTGAEVPSPPEPGQNHIARIEVYSNIARLLQAMQQESEVLNAILQTQMALLQAEEEKEAPRAGNPVPKVSNPQPVNA